MADSPGCCSIWARCLQCLYSCHWRKYPKQKMQSSKVGIRVCQIRRLLGFIGSWEEGIFLSPREENLPQILEEQLSAGREAELPFWGPLSMKWGSAESFSPAPLQCDCIWFGLLFLTFLLSLGWLYIGLILLNDLHNFNECVLYHPSFLRILTNLHSTLGSAPTISHPQISMAPKPQHFQRP